MRWRCAWTRSVNLHLVRCARSDLDVWSCQDAYGLDYDDLKRAVKQQACYKGNFPSPLPIMAFDFFVDPIQLAVAADAGANAVNLNMKILDDSLPVSHLIFLPILRVRFLAIGADIPCAASRICSRPATSSALTLSSR